jgi:ligand-binding sensor domain-containing protein/signal transduction histidine kinase
MFPNRRRPWRDRNRGRLIAWAGVFVAVFQAQFAGADVSSNADFIVRTWQTDDGLPQNSVTSIAQTPDGYLWLGTFNGLVRFDGSRFTVFDSVNTPALTSSGVVWMRSDERGELWIYSSREDLTRMVDGRFERIAGYVSQRGENLLPLGNDRSGRMVLVANKSPLRTYRYENGAFQLFFGSDDARIGGSLTLVQMTNGTLWGYSQSLFRVEGEQAVPVEIPGGEGLKPQALAADAHGFLWIVTKQDVRRVRDGKVETVWPFPEPLTHFAHAQVDRRGNIWIGTYRQGLFRFDSQGRFYRYRISVSERQEWIRCVFIDREENVWIGSDGAGLLRFKPRTFATVTAQDGLKANVTRSVAEDENGTMWVCASGIDWIRPDGRIEHLGSTFSNTIPWRVFPSRAGGVWIGTYGGGVYRYEHGETKPVVLEGAPKRLIVNELFEDGAGTTWIATDAGLWRINGTTNAAIPLPSTVQTRDVSALAIDSHRQIYVGLNGGGLLQLGTNGNWKHFTTNTGLADDHVCTLLVDSDDGVWLGACGNGGLSRFKAGKFFNFAATRIDLPRSITSLTEDDAEGLWVGSNSGIYRILRRELDAVAEGRSDSAMIVRYAKDDGLATLECQPSVWKARDGKIWFATVKGLATVNPKNLPRNAAPPSVLIEDVFVHTSENDRRSRRELLASNRPNGALSPETPSPRKGNTIESVALPPGSQRLEIHFTALSFTAAEKVKFKYMLEGLDQEWIGPDTQRSAVYSHVLPGKYRFRVIACNNDGIWNERGPLLAVTVLPFFWQTTWFKIAMILPVGGILFAAHRYRMSKLEAMVRLRARIASDLHDEVGSNMGAIVLNTGLLRSNQTLTAAEREEVADIHKVALETAHTVREIAWIINPDFDSLPGMIQRLRETAERQLAGRELKFCAPDTMPEVELPLEVRRNMSAVFKEALNNIVKHSAATRVKIDVDFSGETLELTIRDNGRGIAANDHGAGTGQGLRNMQRRIAEAKGRLTIESDNGSGTTVRASVPLP